MSKISSRIGWRSRSRSIHFPDSFVNAFRLPGCVNTSVSKRPIWLVEAAVCSVARPPTTCRMVGSTEEPFGIIGVFVARQPAEDGLTHERDQRVLRVLARAPIAQQILTQVSQTQRLIQLPLGQ
jgi:hypothetical protein